MNRPTDVPELHDVPKSWTWALLDDLCVYIQRGKSPKYDDESPVRVVSQKCVQWSGFDITRARGLRPEALEKYGPERLLREGDLLWNSTGTGTVGRVNVFPGAEGKQVVADSHVTVIRLASVHPHFIYVWLRSPSIQAKIDEMTSGTTKQQELNASTVRLQPVPLPPLGEQKRIVARVEELMGLLDRLEAARDSREATRVALRDAALAALRDADSAEEVEVAWQRIAERMDDLFTDPADVEPLRQTVLQLAVRGRLVPQDTHDASPDRLLTSIAEERARRASHDKARKQKAPPSRLASREPYRIPKAWRWVPFWRTHINRDAERVPLSRAQRKGREGPYDYYGASGVIDSMDDFLFEKPLLLVGEDGANLVLRSTPIAFIARGKYWVNNHAHVLDSVSEQSLRYLAIFLNATDLKPYLTGIAQPKLNQKKMNEIPCPVPPLAEQHRIVAKVDELMALLERLEERLTSAKTSHGEFAASAVHHLDA